MTNNGAIALAFWLLTVFAQAIAGGQEFFKNDMQVRFLETITEKGGKVPFVLKTGRGSKCRSQKLF